MLTLIGRFLLAVCFAVVGTTLGQAQVGPRVVVAKSTSPAAAFCTRPANGTKFTPLPSEGDLYATDVLVALPGATFVSQNRAITVQSLADLNAQSPLPVLETAFSVSDAKDVDLDLTLDRGRINITNNKTEGSASARVRFWNQTWKIVLESPGAQVALELCGRWSPGTRFKLIDPKSDPELVPSPVATLFFLVLKGSALVEFGGVTVAMKAPPGPAELRWDSVGGARPQPQKLDKLPVWAEPDPSSPEAKKFAALVEKFRQACAKDLLEAVNTFLASPDPQEQRIALVTLGALDELDLLGRSLIAAKTLQEWDFGITVLRHWIGRTKGQDQKLYQILTQVRGYTDGQAKIIMQLLFGFSPDDLSQPETYEVLIDYLVHEKPGIRNLAAWHLVRLVPEGKNIPYNPSGSRADAEKAYSQWKKLIPSGQLPPAAKKIKE
jgi:hypothetical protein